MSSPATDVSTLDRCIQLLKFTPRFRATVLGTTDADQYPDGLDLRICKKGAGRNPGELLEHIEIPPGGLEIEDLHQTLMDHGWPWEPLRLVVGRADLPWGGRKNYVVRQACPAFAADERFIVSAPPPQALAVVAAREAEAAEEDAEETQGLIHTWMTPAGAAQAIELVTNLINVAGPLWVHYKEEGERKASKIQLSTAEQIRAMQLQAMGVPAVVGHQVRPGGGAVYDNDEDGF
jgi:hypothetical protein